MRVLIVEKEKTLQQSLFYYLEQQKNCDVFLARSREEGMALWKMSPFDIILCADCLPDGSGLEMLKALRAQRPELISILMSAQHDENLRQEAMEEGIRGYLEKPFDIRQLEEAMGVTHHP